LIDRKKPLTGPTIDNAATTLDGASTLRGSIKAHLTYRLYCTTPSRLSIVDAEDAHHSTLSLPSSSCSKNDALKRESDTKSTAIV
jgi:hypothetical protein